MKAIHFFLHPELINIRSSFSTKIKNLKSALGVELLAIGLLVFILLIPTLLSLFFNSPNILIEITKKRDNSSLQQFDPYLQKILVVLILPILEEVIFRGFLDFKRISVALSSSFLSLLISNLFLKTILESHNYYNIVVIKYIGVVLIGGLVFFLVYIFLTVELLERIKSKYFKTAFYLSAFVFIFVHAFNFSLLEFTFFEILLLPVWLLPQIGGAISLSYIRLKNGLLWAIVFHIAMNSIWLLIS